MPDLTLANHNMLFRLDKAKWTADLNRCKAADIIGCQEAGGPPPQAAIRDWATANGYGVYGLGATANPILYDRSALTAIPAVASGVETAHPRAGFMRLNPARTVSWLGFIHHASGRRLVHMNTHAVSAYTQDEAGTPQGPRGDEWKNWAAKQLWLTVIRVASRLMWRGEFDAVTITGDFNAQPRHTGEWYYPARLLTGLFDFGLVPSEAIDWIGLTRDSDAGLSNYRRVTQGVHSDHAIKFADLTFR